MENNQITLVQVPVIKHKLKEAGKAVSKRIEDLDLDKQVATPQTVKSLKTLRTELNKELLDFETQRKYIKREINKPYEELNAIYETEIAEKYKSGIDTLKDKIATVEDQIKSNKKQAVKEYFNELCVAEKIDFISFEKLGIEPNLSVTEKKYKEQVYDYISKINDDLSLIKTTDFEAEILTEYKGSLNVSSAITTVKTRKEAEAKEKARLKAQKIQSRKNYLTDELGMFYSEITQTYDYNTDLSDIHIDVTDIENLSKEDFTAKYSELEVKINDVKNKELEKAKELEKQNTIPVVEAEVITEKPIIKQPTVSAPIVRETFSAPVSAPKVEKQAEPLKTASFEVKATMTQLRALGEYMKANNIIYKNI